MKRAKRLLLAIIAVAIVVLLVPRHVIVAPEWKLKLTDEAGNPMADVEVNETSQDYSIEAHAHEETRRTDTTGTVLFPRRMLRSSALWDFAGCVRQFSRYYVHASCGPHSWLSINYPAGFGQNDVREFSQAELSWSSGTAHRTSIVILHKCKNGGTGLTCSST